MIFDLSVLGSYWGSLLEGLVSTLWLCATGAAAAGFMGLVIAAGQARGGPVIGLLIRGYTAITLALPFLVLIYIGFFILPEYGLILPPKVVGICTIAIYYGPYVAEVVRAAVSAIPFGTMEAAVAMGMTPLSIAKRVILPQALPLLLPTLTGLLIGLIKDSALLSVISVHEFMFSAKEVVSATYAPLEVYVVVALTYWGLTALLHSVTRHWEGRLNRGPAGLS